MSLQSLLGGSAPPMSLSLSPVTVYGVRSSVGTCTSSATTVTVTGGVAPYTYAWSYVSGDNTMSAVVPTGVSTGFSASLTLDQEKSAVWQCVATDNLGTPSSPVQVNVTLIENSFN